MPWTGRANRSWIPATVSAPGRGGRRSPDRPASSCGSRSEPPRKGLTRPMLSAGNALDPGPQPKHPGAVKLWESPGKAGGLLKGNYSIGVKRKRLLKVLGKCANDSLNPRIRLRAISPFKRSQRPPKSGPDSSEKEQKHENISLSQRPQGPQS